MKLNTIAALMTVVAIVASMSSCKNNDSVIEKIDLIPVKTSKEGNWSMIDKKYYWCDKIALV